MSMLCLLGRYTDFNQPCSWVDSVKQCDRCMLLCSPWIWDIFISVLGHLLNWLMRSTIVWKPCWGRWALANLESTRILINTLDWIWLQVIWFLLILRQKEEKSWSTAWIKLVTSPSVSVYIVHHSGVVHVHLNSEVRIHLYSYPAEVGSYYD